MQYKDSALPLTADQVKKCTKCSNENLAKYYDFLRGTCSEFNINSEARLAAFFSQISHESANLSRIVENLNYSAKRLMQVWPKRFPTVADAIPYERNPEKLANLVYANRMGNGSEESGDGWKYRGRGFIQLTGRWNYQKLSEYFGEDFVERPDLLLDDIWCSLSAGWFWVYGTGTNLNYLADQEDILEITKKINGGVHGLSDRLNRYNEARAVLAGFDREYERFTKSK